ncbi:MAG: AroM family protein [Lachnospiraceae bacterium]|nr:AroM family protein [Lachnospiraceae bacterium]
MKIGAITVGQSPRTDLMPDMEAIFMDSIEVIQMGGLDGLTREEIAAFTPGPDDHVLVSRLTDGTSVTFGESHVLPRMQDCITKLEAQGVSLILFLCTGEFPEDFSASVPLIFPNRILTSVVPAAIPGCRLAVFTPSADQITQVTNKWLRASAAAVTVIPVSPYNGLEPVLSAAANLNLADFDMIVMDCIGYTVEMKEKIHAMTGRPVVLPRTLVARMINELV